LSYDNEEIDEMEL